ncbi:amino acid ABC transporter permease [Pseudarthrobacter sp. AB1]|nr:amino acid ABC transporter permease [Pseudarthrobacter sp. AB1]
MVQAAPIIFQGFVTAWQLALIASVGALLLGFITVAMRVSPVPPLRWGAAAYITLVRNTPLTVVFFIVAFGLPQVDIHLPFFTFAVIALAVYTATFVAEAIRSGIHSIPTGQLEAAKSIGMTFPKIMQHVVLPQAWKAVIAPMASVLIALFKNTSIASAFGVAEAISKMTSQVNVHSSQVILIMFITTCGYVLTGLVMGRVSALVERRAVVLR